MHKLLHNLYVAIDNTHKWLNIHEIRKSMFDRDSRYGSPDKGNRL